MNLFRSEEHAKAWSKYASDSAERTMPLRKYAKRFATDFQRLRLNPDYFENRAELQRKRDIQRAAIVDD